MDPLLLAFVTGLTTGGISCIAVQGGLLASVISQKETQQKSLPLVSMFLISKIIAYTLLGFLLGGLGSAITISPALQGWMQIFAGLYILVTAANLLNLHPVFRHFVIQPPKFAFRLLKNQTRAKTFFAPAVLGFLTILIPCGVTQAMMIFAISSGSPLLGAGIMAAFTLGTTPVFATIGLAASTLLKKKMFIYLASAILFVLGISSLNAGQNLRGSVHTIENYIKVLQPSSPTSAIAASLNAEGKQEVTITVNSNGYQSNITNLKSGVPVKLKLVTDNTFGCSRSFTIPQMGISKVLPETGTETIEFTPTKAGRLAFTCSMGMFSGAFQVI